MVVSMNHFKTLIITQLIDWFVDMCEWTHKCFKWLTEVRTVRTVSMREGTIYVTFSLSGWVGLRSFSEVVVTSNHVGVSFNLSTYHHRGCLNHPIFSNLGLYTARWARFICHHELLLTSISHSISSLNSSLDFAEGNLKITILSLDMFVKIFLFQVDFPILFSIAVFSPYFLLDDLLLQYVALFRSRN